MKARKQMSVPGDRTTARHQVAATVLFADICGSTQLFEEYGNWQARQIESRILELLKATTAEFDGTVIKTIGDEIMSRFPDAKRAMNAACEMQTVIKDDSYLMEFNISIKIGLQHGPVLVEQDDLFGDAVNVAARMVSLAKADQIITTRETVSHLPDDLEQMTRSLGRSWVRGKQDEMEIVEVLWQEPSSLTQVVSIEQEEELRSVLAARLILIYRGATFEVMPSSRRFTLGRGEKNNLVVDNDRVSRSHAEIQFRQGKFILADGSTNGTYLLLENGTRFFVQREEFTLHGRGVICLGRAGDNHSPDLIHFECVQA
jgi:class 3 adenylate cyclase